MSGQETNLIDLGNGLFAELASSFDLNCKKTFVIVADLRKSDNPNLNIIPAKAVTVDYKETLSSYRLNMVVLKEYIYEKDITRNS